MELDDITPAVPHFKDDDGNVMDQCPFEQFDRISEVFRVAILQKAIRGERSGLAA